MLSYLIKFLLLALTSLIVFGCATQNINKVKQLPKNENEFAESLSNEYMKFAIYELKEMHDDWDAHIFAKKALAAKKGEQVLPELTSKWRISKNYKELANNKRKEILTALKDKNSINFPHLSAKAQIGFDCWLEQLEEGWQHDHIKECYEMMNKSLLSLKKEIHSLASDNPKKRISSEINEKERITPAKIITDNQSNQNGILVQKLKVYFDHNEYNLNNKAIRDLEIFFSKIKNGYTRIILEGHTDRSGTEKYNLNLANKRAKAVKEYLVKRNILENAIITKVYGESQPLIHTRDGIREEKNRRVHIEISYDQDLISRL